MRQLVVILVLLDVGPALLEAKLVLHGLVQPDPLLFVDNLIVSDLARFFRPVIIDLYLKDGLPAGELSHSGCSLLHHHR